MNRRVFLTLGAGVTMAGGAITRKALAEEENGASSLSAAEIEELLKLHNAARAEVGVEPLTWSEKCSAAAQKWVDHLIKTDTYDHEWGDFGENLALGSSVAEMFGGWMAEKALYHGQAINKTNTHEIGHYTQIVWRKSTTVGGAKGTHSRGTLWVCYYDPPGNWRGETPY